MPLALLLPLLLASRRPPAPAPIAAPRKVAVVVGVSGYLVAQEKGKGGFESLRYAHLDAERMAKRLTGLGWEVKLLESFPGATASGATKAKVLAALGSLGTERDDTLLFYFSGHGVRVDGKDHLVPADGVFANVSEDPEVPKWKAERATLLGYDELAEAFSHIRASRRLVVVDACRDEPKASKDGAGPSARVDQAKLGEVVQTSEFGATSYAVMYSCRPGQRSYEDGEAQGGVYTGAWLEALDSGRVTNVDGEVTLDELNKQVRARVAAWTARHPGSEMSPNMDQHTEDPIVVGVLRSGNGGSAVLLPTRARLVVTSDAPGATLRVDGSPATGLTYEAEVGADGRHEIRAEVSAPGRESATYRVTLEAGKETKVEAKLEVATSNSNLRVARRRDYSQLLPGTSVTAKNGVYNAAFSPRDGTLAVCSLSSDVDVTILDGRTLDKIRGVATPAQCLAFSPDGATIACGRKDGVLKLGDVASGDIRATAEGHSKTITSVVYSPDGRLLATGSDDGTAILRDPATGHPLRVLPHGDKIRSISFSPDGRTVATASSGQTILWDTSTGARVRELNGGLRIAFCPTGLLVCGIGPVFVIDPATGNEISKILVGDGASSNPWELAVSPDGATLATVDTGGRVALWDIATGELVRQLEARDGHFKLVNFHPDGNTVLITDSDIGRDVFHIYRLPG